MQIKKNLLFFLSLVVLSSFALAQQDVTGTVTDTRDNSPLSGVSVFVRGTRTGTTTDANGHFRISAPAKAVLVFTYTGFADKEVTVTGSSMNVSLSVTQSSLQE